MSEERQEKRAKSGTAKPRYDYSYTQNRELSWLRFNERVLEEAQDLNVPLFERMKFLSIFSSNLDEFFMVRVGSIFDLTLLKQPHIDNKTGMKPSEQLHAIFKFVAPLYKRKDKIFFDLEMQFRQHDIYNLNLKELANKEKKFIDDYFSSYIFPVLSPQIIDLQHPFPHLANNALYVLVELKSHGKVLYGVIPIPNMLPHVVYLPGSSIRFVMTEKVVLEYVHHIFSMYTILGKVIVSVTRNADINLDDEQYDIDEDYRHHMKKVLKKRARLAPVRLEIQGDCPSSLINFFSERLDIKKEQIYKSKVPLKLSYIFELQDRISPVMRRSLTYGSFRPQVSTNVNRTESILKQVLKRDILLFYPYEQMDTFLNLLQEAAFDPNVISIKITIYRLDKQSKLVEYLSAAVENNKEVTVLIELRARFDEQNNIAWSGELQDAGCQVIYGFERFKVHSKICLITRRDKGRIQYITQIGTGNYNEKTARLYTDLCLMTCNNKIGADAALFFQNMAIANLEGNYQCLFVAPHEMRDRMIHLIDQQISKGSNGYIFMKMNSLTDRVIIDKLAEASQSGVKVELIIRGICCIVPGIPNKTEHITVSSIVGRFLEHSRIYCFGDKLEDIQIYIGSADMMTRNTIKRVEVLTPIIDIHVQKQILALIDIIKKDTIKARVLQPDGSYQAKPLTGAIAIDSQAYFANLAMTQAAAFENQRKRKNGFFHKLKDFLEQHD